MGFVTINDQDYDVYSFGEDALADAQTYLAAQITATDWANATPDQQSAALVSMTRTLDRQNWLGKQNSPESGIEHAFPRTGLFYSDGVTPVNPDVVPVEVIEATFEGAAQLVAGVAIQDEATTYDFTRSLKAGSVEIVKFRSGDPSPRFPQVVQELIGLWLGGGSTPLGSISYGTRGRSIMEERYDVSRGF